MFAVFNSPKEKPTTKSIAKENETQLLRANLI